MSPRIYSIEGNIGAGKTTILEEIELLNNQKICVVREPVDAWTSIRDSNDENILEKFYKDPKSYSFPFQVLAFNTRLNTLKNALIEYSHCDVILCERSLHADGYIFAKMLYHDGFIDEISYRIYEKMYSNGIQEFPLSGVIYLDVEPEICAERILKRGRMGEENIKMDYLQRCHVYHQTWLNTTDLDYPVIKYTNITELISSIMNPA
jgi:deoxycitidine kinase